VEAGASRTESFGIGLAQRNAFKAAHRTLTETASLHVLVLGFDIDAAKAQKRGAAVDT
jgi:hypothetical protein